MLRSTNQFVPDHFSFNAASGEAVAQGGALVSE